MNPDRAAYPSTDARPVHDQTVLQRPVPQPAMSLEQAKRELLEVGEEVAQAGNWMRLHSGQMALAAIGAGLMFVMVPKSRTLLPLIGGMVLKRMLQHGAAPSRGQ